MIRRRAVLALPIAALAAPALPFAAASQERALPPHGFLFGAWTGGIFPATETGGAACFVAPTLIVTPDVILRAASLDVAFRQRLVESVALIPQGVEIRLAPFPARGPEVGFGCDDNPDLLRVTRRGEDEIALDGCSEFPFALRRCKG